MPSSPSMEPRSRDTLDCSTGAIILREGAGAVVSTYLTESESALAGAPTQTQTPTPTSPESMAEPPQRAWPIVRPGPATERARQRELAAALAILANVPKSKEVRETRERRRDARPSPRRAPTATASPAWTRCGMFALGAAVAAIAGRFADRGDFFVAVVASLLAGVLTTAVVLAGRRQVGWRPQ
jgi:hypothetical protein